jgi:hypothetical protein
VRRTPWSRKAWMDANSGRRCRPERNTPKSRSRSTSPGRAWR